jgi:hypothetical protein
VKTDETPENNIKNSLVLYEEEHPEDEIAYQRFLEDGQFQQQTKTT